MSTVQVPYTQASNIAPLPTTTYLTTTSLPVVANTPAAPLGAPLSGAPLNMGKAPLISNVSSNPIVATEAGPIYEIELKKRLLDGQRELKEKQADMESDKEKKLEEKADKHRTKAVKWIGRGYPGLASRHEKSATKFDLKANEHYMVAEQLRAQAKAIDRERKSFDPPKEEKKKPAAKAVARKPSDPSRAPTQQRTTTTTREAVPSRSAPVAAAAPVANNNNLAPIRMEKMETASLPVTGEQPSLRKEEAPVQREVTTTEQRAPAVATNAPMEEVKEVKTEKVVEEKPATDKEEKHHHLGHHHEEKTATAGGSSH
eukprot:TRINITY_DN48_c1_g1_i2.p1 TRINITY_DN48_c1_g1~~TRINITY_DN48_c1_g1_i2.p1  ORF type:complete len:315 (-),score=122.78 TRINITY_DN48_c1_g1_i2:95-1039(-)